MPRKSPAFSFYPDSWLSGTLLMDRNQKGMYIDLLGLFWLHGSLTRDKILIGLNIAKGSDDESVLDELLEEKCVCESGKFTNLRLEDERGKQQARSESGKKGGSKTQANRKQSNKQKSKQTPSENEANLQPSVSVSVSVSDSVLDSESDSEDIPPPELRVVPFDDVWGSAMSGCLSVPSEVKGLFSQWSHTRQESGRLIGMNQMQLRGLVDSMFRSGLSESDQIDCLRMCANNGWKTFNVAAWRRQAKASNPSSGPTTFHEQKRSNTKAAAEAFIRKRTENRYQSVPAIECEVIDG